jgi:hypothetical protein
LAPFAIFINILFTMRHFVSVKPGGKNGGASLEHLSCGYGGTHGSGRVFSVKKRRS